MEGIEDDDVLRRILDRTQDLNALTNEAKDWWRYDLSRRRVGAAYRECDVRLDLASFMLSLAERKAVINIPTYSRRRARSAKEGERIVSAKNRHGKIIGVTANKTVFSFSAKIQDVNVVSMETVGEPRNFMMVDVDGTWYEGWKTIELLPKAEENAFLHEHSQGEDEEETGERTTPWENYKVDFDHFVDKKRWQMFYGRYYFLTMALIARLYDEARYYKQLAKDLQAQGVKPPVREKGATYHHEAHEELESIEVDAFEAEVDLPPFKGGYEAPEVEDDEELLSLALTRSRKHIYKDIPWFRWSTRATDYAFHFYGNKEEEERHGKDDKKGDVYVKKKPKWASGFSWQAGVKLPRKRIQWNRIEYAPGIGIRYRVWSKTEKVNPTEEERRGGALTDTEAESSAREESETDGGSDDGHTATQPKKRAAATRRTKVARRPKKRGRSETGEEVPIEDSAKATKKKRRMEEEKRMKKGWTSLGHTSRSQNKGSAEEEETKEEEEEEEDSTHDVLRRRRSTRLAAKRSADNEAAEAENEKIGDGPASHTRSRPVGKASGEAKRRRGPGATNTPSAASKPATAPASPDRKPRRRATRRTNR